MKAKLSLIAAALALAASSALAQPGPGYGPGAGYGPGGGYGPGMMGGYGPGYGRGMMGGYGYGPGYGRGGYGGGYGYGLASLDLTQEQQDKISAIQEENRSKNWGTMGQMRSEMYKLQRMLTADKVDTKAVGEQQKKVDELRRQMLLSRVEAHKQIEAVLTPEQRKKFRDFRPWWGGEADDGE
jgi:Spy/CpxP family protein refolding chaperone